MTDDRQKTIPDEKATKLTIDTSMFENGEKAQALIQFLDLGVEDSLEENGDTFTVNPRQELQGTSPKEYEREISIFKTLLSPVDVAQISKEIKSKKKNHDEALYNRIAKKVRTKVQNIVGKKTKDDTVLSDRQKDIFWLQDKTLHIVNILYHLMEKGEKDFQKAYRAAWFGKEIPDIRTYHNVDDGEYRVLTDSEADDAADEYLDDEQWKMCVEGGHTTEGYEEWKQSVLDIDGRGQQLNHYDGSEETEHVNGTDYYIYRTN